MDRRDGEGTVRVEVIQRVKWIVSRREVEGFRESRAEVRTFARATMP